MFGLCENFLDSVKVPTSDSDLLLNVHLCLKELIVPFFNDSDSLLDCVDRLTWGLLEYEV